ncbi:MAG: tRNA (uridine(34)/cytosine(34)/5-carboxymethylaminomethyluridine(34)-2'-O)-methyltransferase TrmL [Sphaerochaetaceae bacterium]|jgi:tRNA (cytidine/uridine-2'-O-)-methyltransferase|nr:tRNA (uridine(34)/cytosine(34)/5-carboxymethylaminomethyluridine(34)-2'-O)-methyltransferase TrmL [Sphaerochaetaceae bacterium]
MKINVVLFEPEIPQNTGNIARTCAAAGADLHLVGPLGFCIDEKHVRRAGLDYWDAVNIFQYKDIQQFMEEHGNENLFFYTTKAHHCYSDDVYHAPDIWLVFGKESAGIPEEILVRHPDRCLRIPMISDTRSLNLSNSVAIAVYEALRQNGFKDLTMNGNLHRLSW